MAESVNYVQTILGVGTMAKQEKSSIAKEVQSVLRESIETFQEVRYLKTTDNLLIFYFQIPHSKIQRSMDCKRHAKVSS